MIYQEKNKDGSPQGHFYHNGSKYDLNNIFKIAHHKPVKILDISKLKWILKYTKLNKKRLKNADVSWPLIVVKIANRYVVVDGAHRLQKSLDLKMKTVKVKQITKSELEKTKLRNLLKNPIINKKYIFDDITHQFQPAAERLGYGRQLLVYIKTINDIFPESKITLLYEGGYGEQTFLVLTPKPFIIKFGNFTNKQISILKKLSELELIPKIYTINQSYYIMQFITGTTLDKLFNEKRNFNLLKYIIQEAEKELNRWHKNGFAHSDVAERNMLVDTKGKVWIIDPDLNYYKLKNDDIEMEMRNDIRSFKLIKTRFSERILGT